MRTILDTIAEYTQLRIEEEKKNISAQAMRRQAEEIYRQESAAGAGQFPFEIGLHRRRDLSHRIFHILT